MNNTHDVQVARTEMRFLLASALIGSKQLTEGAKAYRDAIEFARSNGSTSIAVARSAAVVSNNLAYDLLELPARTSADDELMRLASRAAHEFWQRGGNWINEEQALTLLARVACALNQLGKVLEHADAALAVIAANGRRPFDTAILHLLRAKAHAALGDADSRRHALTAADEAAAGLTAEDLKQRFATERAEFET